MTPLVIHYSDHALKEMRKARITRQVVRLTLQQGAKRFSFRRGNHDRWISTLAIENVTYEVCWVQDAGYVVVITTWRKGVFD